MFIFEYGEDWANIFIARLAERHQALDPEHGSYACLCIGRKLDPILEQHYLEIDKILTPSFHIFSLFPPPHDFVVERFKALRTLEDAPSEAARSSYKSLLNKERKDPPHEIVRAKVQLLTGLVKAGLEDGQYADFLFFAFRPDCGIAGLDVIAAAAQPLDDDARPQAYIELFASMAKKAVTHSEANDSVEAFVKDLPLSWTARVDIQKAEDLLSYITGFIQTIRGAA